MANSSLPLIFNITVTEQLRPTVVPSAISTSSAIGRGTERRNDGNDHQFQVGRTYGTRSIRDYGCIHSFTILARTAKTITTQVHGKTVAGA